jgi:DNA-binding transcriptional MerR regulator
MRIGDLSRRSGVSVPTIKYYLRDGLLPPGELTSPNQAQYGEEHVQRLGLIRALLDVGGLTVAAVREVLAAIDEPDTALHKMLGVAQHSFAPSATLPDSAELAISEARIAALLERRGWQVKPDNPSWRTAAEVLTTLRRLGFPERDDWLEAYGAAAEIIAEADVTATASAFTRESMVQALVVGTLLGDALFSALRRLAHEDASSRRFPPAD